nr:hypothetical protein [Deltaproteobacteria bacterium]
MIIPPTVVIAAFSRQVLFAWTGRPDTAEHAHLVLTLLIVGTCLNGLMNFPSSSRSPTVDPAHRGVNALAVLVIVPLEGFGARRWGARGAAVGWLILNASYVLRRPAWRTGGCSAVSTGAGTARTCWPPGSARCSWGCSLAS